MHKTPIAAGLLVVGACFAACGPTGSSGTRSRVAADGGGVSGSGGGSARGGTSGQSGTGGAATGGTGGAGTAGAGGSGTGGAGGTGGAAGASAGDASAAGGSGGARPPADGPPSVDAASPRDMSPPSTGDMRPSAPDAPVQPPPDMAGAATIPTNGLVAHYRFDETSGTQANDSSANGNHGTLREYGTPDWRTGRRGGALGFDGTGNWVHAPSSASLGSITTAVSVAAWVYRDANGAGWSVVLSRQAGTSGSEHYGLATNSGTPNFLVATNQTGTAGCAAGALLQTGAWVHLAGTYDGATARLYVNGAEVCMFARAVTMPADTTPLIIGGNANSSTDDAQELWQGRLDDVLLYNRALTPAEVANLAR